MSNRLPILATEIAVEHHAATRAAEDFVSHAIEAGKRLLEAKALVPHGGWHDWLKQYLPGVSLRTAQRYMRAADRVGKNDTMSYLSLTDIITDKPAESELVSQVDDLLSVWRDSDPATQKYFRDVVEIVGTGDIPDRYVSASHELVHRTATGLRKLREARHA